MENRWSEIENRGNLGMPAGHPCPRGNSRLALGERSAVATQSKQGQQDLKVVPTPKAHPGDEKDDFQFGIKLDMSNLNRSISFVTFTYMCS